jgi:glycosyltransferase involved in cell wall biosynthesis
VRILVVTVVHDPEDARIRHRQVRSLVAAGHDVAYAAPFSAYRRTPPAELRCLDLPRSVGRRRLAALRAAHNLLRQEAARHDLVLLHDPELLVAARTAGTATSRTVWDVHENTVGALATKAWMPRPVRPIAAAGVSVAQRWAEDNLRLMLAEYGYRPHYRRPHPVVPNTVPLSALEPALPGRDRVVYVGRLTRARGAEELMEMARLLHPEVHVELIGTADEVADELRAAQAEGVLTWHGFLPNDEALQRIGGALAGLVLLHDHPNYAQSRSTKAMEYMASGVPVITTPSEGTADLVRERGCGLVVPFRDAGAAADAVRRLRDDDELRNRLGRAGRRAAVAEFDWDRDAVAFVRQLEEWAQVPLPAAAARI